MNKPTSERCAFCNSWINPVQRNSLLKDWDGKNPDCWILESFSCDYGFSPHCVARKGAKYCIKCIWPRTATVLGRDEEYVFTLCAFCQNLSEAMSK